MDCPACAHANASGAHRCARCGAPLPPSGGPIDFADTRQDFADTQQMAVDTQFLADDSEQEALYRAAIGPRQQERYLRRFLAFDRTGKAGIGWHWPAFFFTFYWLLYRKMWRNALLYAVAPYALGALLGLVIGLLGMDTAPATGPLMALLFGLAFYLVPALYADAWYWRHCRRRIARAQRDSPDRQWQLGALTGGGGTSGIVVLLMSVLALVFCIGVLAAVALPAYQDYTLRARVSQAHLLGNAATQRVATYYYQNKAVAPSLAAAGFTPALPAAVRAIDLDSRNGTVSVVLEGPPALAGKRLDLVPSLDAQGRIVWACKAAGVLPRHLPPSCR